MVWGILVEAVVRCLAGGHRFGGGDGGGGGGEGGGQEGVVYLGGGDCLWLPPVYDVPAEIDLHKTIIAGYPSGDKRVIFIQMEALTGWRKFTCQCYTL